jgi:hypothetical protein
VTVCQRGSLCSGPGTRGLSEAMRCTDEAQIPSQQFASSFVVRCGSTASSAVKSANCSLTGWGLRPTLCVSGRGEQMIGAYLATALPVELLSIKCDSKAVGAS